MRTRKPVATSRGNACHRCTALLQSGVERCSMCGWPAGLGYPPVDGEMEGYAAVSEPEPTVDADAEHAAAQLDALAGMAQRQSQPTVELEPQPTQSAPATPVADTAHDKSDDAPTAPVAEAPVAEPRKTPVQAEEPISTPALAQVAPAAPPAEPDDVDPLTAPIEALTDAPGDEAHVVVEATPIAEVAAEAVSHDSLATADEVSEIETTESVESGDEVELDVLLASVEPVAGRTSSLARPAQLLIVAAAVLNLVLAGIQVAFGSPVDASMTTVVLGLGLLTLAVWTGAAVTFLYWVSRAYAHVAAQSTYRQRHGASMSLVGWVIPIVGIFIGYRVLQDLWAGSDPSTRYDADAKPRNARIVDVWLLGLVTGVLFAYVLPRALGDSALWNGIAALGVAAAGLALASVISTVSRWQDGPDAEAIEDVVAEPVATDEGTVTTRIDDVEAELVTSDAMTPEPATASTE